MSKYIIEGGKKLNGEVIISGSKNAALPIMAGSILNNGKVRLYNVPKIRDTINTLEILQQLGCKVRRVNGKIEINTRTMNQIKIPEEMMKKMRSTIVMAGAILGRFKEVIFYNPGGCKIGKRPIDLHLKVFKKIGVNIEEKGGFIHCKCDKIIGKEINLDFPSVGVTENIILLTVLAEGTTVINNAAKEPEIVDLANFLNKMGAKIIGAGTDSIKIIGVNLLKDIGYNIISDRIEAGTFLCMTAATNGKVKLIDVEPNHLKQVINKLVDCGCNISISNKEIAIDAPKRLKGVNISTLPYPEFPTDMQPIFTSMLGIANGQSIIRENIFENRYKYLLELNKMGIKSNIDEKTAIIKGVKHIKGREIDATDLRGGAALVLAGLVAKGKTIVNNIEYIQRGYENLDKKLIGLGAKIKIENT